MNQKRDVSYLSLDRSRGCVCVCANANARVVRSFIQTPKLSKKSFSGSLGGLFCCGGLGGEVARRGSAVVGPGRGAPGSEEASLTEDVVPPGWSPRLARRRSSRSASFAKPLEPRPSIFFEPRSTLRTAKASASPSSGAARFLATSETRAPMEAPKPFRAAQPEGSSVSPELLLLSPREETPRTVAPQRSLTVSLVRWTASASRSEPTTSTAEEPRRLMPPEMASTSRGKPEPYLPVEAS
mmetsp:Transcript_20786/g.66899  ORF Transcript_20786/g.66899 Transcript_20786/m.66899 type:complete len:240 (+) Transcript_20786:326-1045(+)